jgi:hypothetical protein
MLAGGGIVVEDAAPPSQIVASQLPVVTAKPGNQDELPTSSDLSSAFPRLPVRIPAAFSQLTACGTVP